MASIPRGTWLAGAALAAIWASVIALFLTPSTPQGYGFPHERFASMDQGGDGPARHFQLMLPGYCFAALSVAGYVGLLGWSADRPEDEPAARRRRWLVFLIGGLLFELCLGAVFWSYWRSWNAEDVAFLGPFPAGLAWMLMGVWVAPVYFIVVYLQRFHAWIMPEKSTRRFEALVKARPTDADPTHAA